MTYAHLSLSARALLLTASAALAWPAMAETDAMAASAAVTSVADQPSAPAVSASSDPEDEYDDIDGDEIVVTAPRL
ncbi:MAG: hypothetical protein Q8Q79_01365, partial [Sphingopyxis sp.]|nr:hypothetical protein [Sphingopyxis sp.]